MDRARALTLHHERVREPQCNHNFVVVTHAMTYD